jgi:hypothetical protein
MLAFGAFTASIVMATSVACNGSAVGVESCQTIEEKRCELNPSLYTECKTSGAPKITSMTEVDNCKILYRDQCRVGIAGPSEPKKEQTDACVAAVTAVAACAKNNVADVTMCSNAGADPTQYPQGVSVVSACTAFLHPEYLSACNFIQPAPTTAATTSSTATTSATTGSGGGSGG